MLDNQIVGGSTIRPSTSSVAPDIAPVPMTSSPKGVRLSLGSGGTRAQSADGIRKI
jgi:hypothetical protein